MRWQLHTAPPPLRRSGSEAVKRFRFTCEGPQGTHEGGGRRRCGGRGEWCLHKKARYLRQTKLRGGTNAVAFEMNRKNASLYETPINIKLHKGEQRSKISPSVQSEHRDHSSTLPANHVAHYRGTTRLRPSSLFTSTPSIGLHTPVSNGADRDSGGHRPSSCAPRPAR